LGGLSVGVAPGNRCTATRLGSAGLRGHADAVEALEPRIAHRASRIAHRASRIAHRQIFSMKNGFFALI